KRFVVLIDTMPSSLLERADVVIPGASWVEKTGTFESATGRLQAFERAIEPLDYAKSEAQIALDLIAAQSDQRPEVYNAANTRREMAEVNGLAEFTSEVHLPAAAEPVESDMETVEL
ncbi:MAG: molybdopterin-dependent oxidoreductase, partial [Planctomycetota bacterium]